MELVMKHGANARYPFDTPSRFYVLIETGGSCAEHDQEKLDTFLETVMEKEIAEDGVVAQDETQMGAFWALREGISEACLREGGLYKYDISVPLKSFYGIVKDVEAYLSSQGLYDPLNPDKGKIRHVVGFGHMGDGNVHLNINTQTRSRDLEELLDAFIFKRTKELGGSISAEHGIGLQKANHLSFSKSNDAITMMQQIKGLLDPKGILNPYKFFPDP